MGAEQADCNMRLPGSEPVRQGRVRQFFAVPAPFVEIRTTLDSTLPYADHAHAWCSLGLMLAGQTQLDFEGSRYLAEAGDLVLIPPGRVHSCNPLEGRPRSYHMVYLDPVWLEARAGAVPLPGTGPLIRDPLLYATARQLVARLLPGEEEVRGEYAGKVDDHGGQRAELDELAKLVRLLAVRHRPSDSRAARRTPAWLGGTETVWTRFDGRTEASVSSVTGLARQLGLRRESFSRAVRRLTGLPPGRWLHCLRLERGRRLLRQGCSIAEAAAAAGYADQSHFHRVFVKLFSVTPGCYRNNRSHPFKT